MGENDIKSAVKAGNIFLGIEFGSTRIKAAVITENFETAAQGSFQWENRLENNYWTYSLDDIKNGIQSCWRDLSENVKTTYGEELTSFRAMGISAMMHGYMPFDENDELLVPFRTWRNTNTGKAAEKLTESLNFNMPLRWSISHLYEAVLDKEPHVPRIAYITTLAGYVHYLLTGEHVLGTGDASGMFPVIGNEYNKDYLDTANKLFKEAGFDKDIADLLPKIKPAGEKGAVLTEEGARFIDPSGKLKAGIPVCPPEGDAGTGMTATNSVRPKTGNISAGTSVFSMLVLDEPMKNVYPEIDIVSTPDGLPTAMVHCNNCCCEIDAWAGIFKEFTDITGGSAGMDVIYSSMFKKAADGDPDCGGVTVYSFLSGEPVAGVSDGRPMYFRQPDGKMNFANFMRAQIYASIAPLKLGMDILFEKEHITAERFTGHGGLFKTAGAADQFLADALKTPVSVMSGAGEGGAWGMALLAAYMELGNGASLPDWLDKEVFGNVTSVTAAPKEDGTAGFEKFMARYKTGLDAERKAGDVS